MTSRSPASSALPRRRPAPSAPVQADRASGLSLEARRALGGLLPLIDLPEVRDLLLQVTDGEGRLWLDRSGRLAQVPGWRAHPSAVSRLAVALIAAGGRHLDELNPCADVRLADGIRVHAVLPPVAVAGAAVSIRLPRSRRLSFEEIVAGGLCGERVADLLRHAIRTRKNLLITGGTGTGKTTVLGCLLDLAPPEERILTIEDVAELRLAHPHRVALETRQANSEGVGEVHLQHLLREALRMRPDRIVLGECRGAEVVTLLAALNTGHDGGAGTLHASRLDDVPARLEALGAVAGLEPAAIARQVVSALHLVVHLEREGTRHRIGAIGRFALRADGLLTVEEIA
ncbi:Flp pilus assembly complex ATPase component TadA [Leucobacter sp. CSA1]|uniref:Flp pilus assembly complex ATPase component TadA n=1 Tax=Leucobacter chromiisoli TaxID=2796471 RepID=A0A934QBW6_9MICO|nr:ATPase, T2SS/T4P/T4SS family [Leucobacter chromiisoli]MBK0420232.1 Flp pilus assembly complex ATPase component TadA [Leucobacter chromiisoli]